MTDNPTEKASYLDPCGRKYEANGATVCGDRSGWRFGRSALIGQPAEGPMRRQTESRR